MRARFVYESIAFKRGSDPKRAMDIGLTHKRRIYIGLNKIKDLYLIKHLDIERSITTDKILNFTLWGIPGLQGYQIIFQWIPEDPKEYSVGAKKYNVIYTRDREKRGSTQQYPYMVSFRSIAKALADIKDFLKNRVLNESEDGTDSFEIKYEPWKWSGYSEGHNAWYLYKNGKPIVGISNDNKDQNNVLIRHIESKEKGMATEFILSLLKKGIVVETGKPEYNSISTSAYYMNKKITDLVKKNPDLGFKILGKANNNGKDKEERYKDVMDKKDNYHYKWFKKSSQ